MTTVEEAIQHNWEHFMERGPALSYAYQTYVVARQPSTGRILLGGLGAMGVGQMWFSEEPEHADYPGYAEAELVS